MRGYPLFGVGHGRESTNNDTLGQASLASSGVSWLSGSGLHADFALRSSPIGCTLPRLVFRVTITRLAEKQLRKLPRHIVDNLMIWVAAVENDGLEEVRKVPGYHDEPLRGDRAGQRSIRLGRAYRAIYEIKEDTARFVSVEEVSKHGYWGRHRCARPGGRDPKR